MGVPRGRDDARDPRLEAGAAVDQQVRGRHGLDGRRRRIEGVDVQGHRDEKAHGDLVARDVTGVLVHRIERREGRHTGPRRRRPVGDCDVGPCRDQRYDDGGDDQVADDVRLPKHGRGERSAVNKDFQSVIIFFAIPYKVLLT